MKILYDHSIFQLQQYGGISRYFYELITRLSIKEHIDVNLFGVFHINEYGLSNHKHNFNSMGKEARAYFLYFRRRY